MTWSPRSASSHFSRPWSPWTKSRATACPASWSPQARGPAERDCCSSSGPTRCKLTGRTGPAAVIGPSALLVSWLHEEESFFPFAQAAPGAPGPQSACCSSSSRCSS
ncbi:uncharacterized protein LOC118907468 isoform X1 [Manis pentadactyla]|uniref:uncharacterized protein LOC118907468 isoform X1 n=1 Tax=Manis pentadactyla TaxID=143292 RepID=UPI00255CCBCD|nr:uncharacterized protein LOC118907468 isoform X1 [Manis pentadactyla]